MTSPSISVTCAPASVSHSASTHHVQNPQVGTIGPLRAQHLLSDEEGAVGRDPARLPADLGRAVLHRNRAASGAVQAGLGRRRGRGRGRGRFVRL